MSPFEILRRIGERSDLEYEALQRNHLQLVCDAAILARRLADPIDLDAGCGGEVMTDRDDEPSGGTGLGAVTNGRPGERTDLRRAGRPFTTVARRAVPSPSSAARRATDCPFEILRRIGERSDLEYEALQRNHLQLVCDAAILARRLADPIDLDAGCGGEVMTDR